MYGNQRGSDVELGLKGKNALVTGGSHGIGRSIALALADEGCNVAICARSKENIAQVTKDINKKGVNSIGVVADVLIPENINSVMKQIVDAWEQIHILVNNVGGGGRWGSEVVEETSEQVWHDVYSKNALAAVRFTRMAIPFMRKQKWGRVVTISSICGKEGGGRPWFAMAKSAEISLMKSLAMIKYLSREGITFNTVAPGAIMIPDTGWENEKKKKPEELKRMIEEQYPLGRLGTPDEVANVVAFICSEKASLINGATIIVDGAESRTF